MRLSKLRIENYRGIEDVEIEFEKTTVLIGDNNAGKSSILDALSTCMTRTLSRRAMPFTEFDFHLGNGVTDPAQAQPIVVTLQFEERTVGEWPAAVVQAFPGVIQLLDDDRQSVALRVTSQFDAVFNDFVADWRFLDRTGAELASARNPRLVADLQQLAPVFLLSAVRDAAQHFGTRSQFWAPFTKTIDMSEEQRLDLEQQLAQINQAVLDGHQPFVAVKDELAKAGALIPLGADPVSIEAVPARVLDMLARTQVRLATVGGARLPVAQHGAGTQSLSVLFLFEAFVAHRLAQAFDVNAEPLLALEEPEAHLHPSAIRALWPTLDGLAGQKVIATHSGDLLSAVPLMALRRLARRGGRVVVFRVGRNTLNPAEAQKLSYHVRAKRGALLFARCWLLVEGESEFVLISEMARLSGIDLELEGVATVEFAQCGLEPLVKVARDLGIEWHLLTDGDTAGTGYVQSAQGLLLGDLANDRITQLTDLDIEHSIWNAGLQFVYENAVTPGRRAQVTSPRGTPAYVDETIKAAVKSSKPRLAHAVVEELVKPGAPPPPAQVLSAVNRAVALARMRR